MEFCLPRWGCVPWFRFTGPLILFGLIIYCTWGYAHKLCYDQIWQRFQQRPTAIGLICTVSFLDALLIFIWYQAAIAVGPGRLPKVPPYMILPEAFSIDNVDDQTADGHSLIPPVCYQSCPRGNPIWCPACDSVKTERAHHSSDLKYCVPRFDHRCAWLGIVIGKDNYRFFIQFSMYMSILSLIVFVSICAFIRRIVHDGSSHRSLNANIIVVLIIAAFGWLMTISMLLAHAMCIATNSTSVELMARNEKSAYNRMICCYSFETKMRYVVELRKDELRSPWRKSTIWRNAVDCLGPNVLLWLVPLTFGKRQASGDLEDKEVQQPPIQKTLGQYYEPFSSQTMDLLEKKIANGDYLTTFHAYGDKYI